MRKGEKNLDNISKHTGSEFGFIFMIVDEEIYDEKTAQIKKQTRFVCTDIQEYSNVDENLKSKLTDEAKNDYENSNKRSSDHGKVTTCLFYFPFSTYESANKKREESNNKILDISSFKNR